MIAVVVLLTSAGSVLAQDNDSTLIVEVVNKDGRPVKYACVTLVPKSGDILFQKADGRGIVRVKNLYKGRYRVVVKVDGYIAQKREISVTEKKDTVGFVMETRN